MRRDLLHELPSDADVADLAAVFDALGQPVRLRILSMLAIYGGMRVMEIVEQTPLNQATVSYHLRVLAEAGLIARSSRTAPYCLVPGALERLAGALGVLR
jgi:ArsR family transcriptional regulator